MPADGLISYCIATFRRPDFLRHTVSTILQQEEQHLEVVVSDNDPAGSAGPVLQALADPRVRYFCNDENVGMVRNFNRALAEARGDWVVMITDDDPVVPSHGRTLRELAARHPGHGAYFGVGYSFTDEPDLALAYQVPVGDPAPLGTGAVETYTGQDFARRLLRYQVKRYMLWSCGMVRRDIAQQVKMPDYGSPFLTDFAYLALVCQPAGIVVKDEFLGKQRIHPKNFGRDEIAELGTALEGFRAVMGAGLHGEEAARDVEFFCRTWATAHLAFLYKFRRIPREKRKVLAIARGLGRREAYRWLATSIFWQVNLEASRYSAVRRPARLLRRVVGRLLDVGRPGAPGSQG